MKTAKIEKIEISKYEGKVYNLELQTNDKENDDLFWVCNGIVVHNCFPKDLNALIQKELELGLNPTMLKATWEKNLEVRPQKDWDKLLGRAVSKKQK